MKPNLFPIPVLVAMLAACLSPAGCGPGTIEVECAIDPDCGGSLVCRSGACVDPCSGVVCDPGEVCVAGVCEACEPDCAGRECGPDPVCTASCGDCDSGEVCTIEGVCTGCMPDCAGRECGPDPVCNVLCGECDPGDTCSQQGRCEACVPDCSGLECGNDPVCGASCGTCSQGRECEDGACVCVPRASQACHQGDVWWLDSCGQPGEMIADCANGCADGLCLDCTPDCAGRACGPDPLCGASCGSCTPPDTCSAQGQCTCTPACAGKCGGAGDGCSGTCTQGCPSGQWCDGLACTACDDDGHCGEACLDCAAQSTDRACVGGACGCSTDQDCAAGSVCSGSRCESEVLPGDWVQESARSLPLAYDVDVVVVGGSSAAVEAAASAANEGATVFLAAPRPYLGEDICGTLRLWLEPGEEKTTPLAHQLFPDTGPARPLHVKRSLDQALEDAGVEFLYGCYPTDLLRDPNGNLAGIVMANRSGRQAVRARVIIDATDRAWVARMAGARFGPFPSGPQSFTRVVVGGQAQGGPGATARTLPFQIGSAFGQKNVYEYTLTIQMENGSFRSFAQAEQVARDRTFHPGQVDDSEVLFQVPPDPMEGVASLTGPWPGAAQVGLDALRPDDVDRLYVLGGCADISRGAAADLLRPVESMHLGVRVGEAAAAEALALPHPAGVHLPARTVDPVTPGDVGEFLRGVRPASSGAATVPASARGLPVLGEYDVVVVGGGTGGAPAGIGAGRRGATTLLIEYLHGLGGVGTHGLIGRYHHGYRHGFTAEIDGEIEDLGASSYVVGKTEVWRRENRSAGTEIWFGTMGVGAFAHDDRLKGVVVATPEGRGVVLAEVVIDSTGNADIAAAAGAACMFVGAEHVAVQGTGLPPRQLGAHYTNTDYTFSDDGDPLDSWHLFVWAREKFPDAYDLGQIIDTRERRRIIGDYVVSPLDLVNSRTYSDSVVFSQSNFDTHGFIVHPYLYMVELDRMLELYAYTPYRSLLPAGLDGVLVTGLGISAHRDAMPVLRMQPDIQNQGYAAGRAAAMAAEGNTGTRGVDIDQLQQHLVNIGSLPSGVRSHTDGIPVTEAQVGYAVDVLADRAPGAAVDDGENPPAFGTTGYWRQSQSIGGYYGSGYLATDEKGPTATWTADLSQPGPYGVYMRWTELSNRVPSAPVDILHAGGSTRVHINQQTDGSRWKLLGAFDFGASGSAVLRTQGTQAGKYAIADAVSFAEAAVVDDGHNPPAFSATGTWRDSQSVVGYHGSGYLTTDEKGPTATWTTSLSLAGEHAVYMRWTEHENRVANTPVDIVHTDGTTRVYVNQRTHGGRWNLLGKFDFGASGTVVLRTQGTPAGQYVVADAVLFAKTDMGGVGNEDSVVWLVSAVMSRPGVALPLMRQAYGDSTTAASGKLRCAQVLGLLGDATGADTLVDVVEGYDQLDEGWNFNGMGQWGVPLSPLDSYLMALGGTRDGAALGPLLAKLALLDATKEFSHHRAVAVGLEGLADPAAAQPLAQLLQKPGMTGYSVLTLDDARNQYGPDPREDTPRNNSLRELIMARALYRCGDHQGLGRAILELYADDLRGPYARHARAVLD